MLMAASAMGFVYLLVAGALLVLYRAKRLLPIAIVVVSSFFVGLQFIPADVDSRLLRVITSSDAPVLLVRADTSINWRIAHVIAPWWATVRRGTLPGGYNAFDTEFSEFKTESRGFFFYGNGEKIMSWIGAFAFELGFLSIPIFVLMFWCVWDGSRRSVFELAFLAALLASAIPPALPFTGMLLAAMYVKRSAGQPWRARLASPTVFARRPAAAGQLATSAS